jgi:hypothetical protein
MIVHDDGLKILQTQKWDVILTDPDYDNQPAISIYRKYCAGNIIVFCDARYRPHSEHPPDEVLFWQKPISTKWSTKRCNRFIEEIMVYKGKNPIFNAIHWSAMLGLFSDGFINKPAHPFAKPLSMMEKLVLMYSDPGDLVFDPFCGSGTVGIACKRHGRRYVGCEIDRDFFKLAEAAYRDG